MKLIKHWERNLKSKRESRGYCSTEQRALCVMVLRHLFFFFFKKTKQGFLFLITNFNNRKRKSRNLSAKKIRITQIKVIRGVCEYVYNNECNTGEYVNINWARRNLPHRWPKDSSKCWEREIYRSVKGVNANLKKGETRSLNVTHNKKL